MACEREVGGREGRRGWEGEWRAVSGSPCAPRASKSGDIAP